MKSVVIRAPLLSVSGYGEHSRQVYKSIRQIPDLDIKTQVLQWGNTAWAINPNGFDGLAGEIMSKSTPTNEGFDISLQVQLPDEWSKSLAKFNIGVTAGVETDRCNPKWLDAINQMDLVIVPTAHVRDTFLRTGEVKTKIIIIPEWYQETLDKEPLESITSVRFDTKFNFLAVSQLTALDDVGDRKNIFNMLKWFCEVFQDDKDVGLILKTNLGRGTHIDRQNVYGTITNFLNKVRKGQYPKVHIVHGNMSDHEVTSIYRHPSVKCFVSLTRGEGFGLPILDATIAELPVITTNWSGHLDFMKLGKFIAVDYDLVDVPQSKMDGRIFVNQTKWANPREADFKKRILKFRTSYETPKEWAKDLSAKCREKFSRNTIEKQYRKIIEEIL